VQPHYPKIFLKRERWVRHIESNLGILGQSQCSAHRMLSNHSDVSIELDPTERRGEDICTSYKKEERNDFRAIRLRYLILEVIME
jgi:hypothetical protein